MVTKKNIGIICGGKSPEHEVSLLSARNIFQNFDRKKFNVFLIYLDKEKGWYYLPDVRWIEKNKLLAIEPTLLRNKINISLDNKPSLYYKKAEIEICIEIDVAFPIIHGIGGEDGALQGLLEMLEIPFVGAATGPSFLSMDKSFSKIVADYHDIPTAPYLIVRENPNLGFPEILGQKGKEMIENFGYPLFVKPCGQGSSIGVSKVEAYEGLARAIKDAFQYDHKILIEKGIAGREIEIALLGNDDIKASAIGEIRSVDNFYSYDRKYLVDDEAELLIPADLAEDDVMRIQEFARKIYRVFEIKGMARIDMFFTKNGQCYFNEINTLPGFTGISMYPKLWDYSKIYNAQLLEELVRLALELAQQKKK